MINISILHSVLSQRYCRGSDLCSSFVPSTHWLPKAVNKHFSHYFSHFLVGEKCGGHVDASNAGYITSPGYPSEYPPHQNCEWEITAPEPTQRIVLNFNPHFELERLDCRYAATGWERDCGAPKKNKFGIHRCLIIQRTRTICDWESREQNWPWEGHTLSAMSITASLTNIMGLCMQKKVDSAFFQVCYAVRLLHMSWRKHSMVAG